METFALVSRRGLRKRYTIVASSNSRSDGGLGTGNVRTSAAGLRPTAGFQFDIDVIPAVPSDIDGRPVSVVFTRISSSEIVLGNRSPLRIASCPGTYVVEAWLTTISKDRQFATSISFQILEGDLDLFKLDLSARP